MSSEIEIQAKLLFQKTMFEYLNFLESTYLSETDVIPDKNFVTSMHRRANDKMTLINHSLRKYGKEGLTVPKFVNVTGNC